MDVRNIYFARDDRYDSEQAKRCYVTVTEGTTREEAEALIEKLKPVWPDRSFEVIEELPQTAKRIL